MNSQPLTPIALTLFSLFSVAETEGHIIKPDKGIVLGETPVGALCPIMTKIWAANELLARGANTMTNLPKEWRILETFLWYLLQADFGDHPNLPADHQIFAVREGFQVVSSPSNARGDWYWLDPNHKERPAVRVQRIGDFHPLPDLFKGAA